MQLFIGPVGLEITKTTGISFKLLPSKNYTYPLIEPEISSKLHFELGNLHPRINKTTAQFIGETQDIKEMPYSWTAQSTSQGFLIEIFYINDPQLSYIRAEINTSCQEIRVQITPVEFHKLLCIDPMTQPLGSLLMIYLAHITNGFLIHASGVLDNHRSYIFSAVSGTGKSTMAKLWQTEGAEIINDDRLWLHRVKDNWFMFNTPMVFYPQKPKMAQADNILLLSQSKINNITPIVGIKASMQVMSNCIQHFYNQEMTSSHLDSVLDFTSNTSIFNCAFKPDADIVHLIRKTVS